MYNKWINIEDELLKIAVLKFGLNKWEKISSGIIKKNSWDCKKRWYDWVDYRIKKIDWTIQEDKKLVYINEAFKMNWRIISYFLRRNNLQCLLRFKVLLWSKDSRKNFFETRNTFFNQKNQNFRKLNFKKKKKKIRCLTNEANSKIFEFKIRMLNLQGKKKLTRIFKKKKEPKLKSGKWGDLYNFSKKKDFNAKKIFQNHSPFFLWCKSLCLKQLSFLNN